MISVLTQNFLLMIHLFTVVYDETVAAVQLNRDLKVVTDWAYQCETKFNPDIN